MAKVKYFNGDIELAGITDIKNAEFAARFPGVKGRRYDGYNMLVGRPAEVLPVYIQGKGWDDSIFVPVERVVTFKSNPSRHECDARCMNASGRVMNCECFCGGKNHGRGSFICNAVEAA